jgi:hypothetical protein
MFVRTLLRPRFLGAIFGAYVLVIAIIAAFFANGPGSLYRYTASVTQWTYTVDVLLASILLLGLGGVAAVSRRPLEVLPSPSDIGGEPEPVGDETGTEVVEYEEFEELPPPLGEEPAGGDPAERDIDELLSALGDMESTMEAEDGEGIEVVQVPAPVEPQVMPAALPAAKPRTESAPLLVPTPKRSFAVSAYFLGPALLEAGIIGICSVILPGADAFLQTYNQVNTAILLGIAYSYPGVVLYTALSMYGIISRP